jgi:hypothetical protein
MEGNFQSLTGSCTQLWYHHRLCTAEDNIIPVRGSKYTEGNHRSPDGSCTHMWWYQRFETAELTVVPVGDSKYAEDKYSSLTGVGTLMWWYHWLWTAERTMIPKSAINFLIELSYRKPNPSPSFSFSSPVPVIPSVLTTQQSASQPQIAAPQTPHHEPWPPAAAATHQRTKPHFPRKDPGSQTL